MFMDTFNNHQPSMKLKDTTDPNSVNFLSRTQIHTTHQSDIKAYFKDTETHVLSHKHSYHLKHTRAGLIKSPSSVPENQGSGSRAGCCSRPCPAGGSLGPKTFLQAQLTRVSTKITWSGQRSNQGPIRKLAQRAIILSNTDGSQRNTV